jgi:hypothetical protein
VGVQGTSAADRSRKCLVEEVSALCEPLTQIQKTSPSGRYPAWHTILRRRRS